MSSQPRIRLTAEEYLERERKADTKSEYLDGEIYAMSGATRRHNLIAGNIHTDLNNQLRDRDCEVYGSDMRVKVTATSLYAYPDVSAVCGEPSFENDTEDVLLNPNLLIEVLSDSTEAYDRGEKSEHYRQIESLAEYLLVSQKKMHLEIYCRQPEGRWLLRQASQPEEAVRLESIGCHLTLSDIYRKVRFEMHVP